MKRTAKQTDQNALIKARSWGQIVGGLLGQLVLPLISFVWALISYDVKSFWFWWNMICFANCLALCYTVNGSTLSSLIDFAKNPDIDSQKYINPSIAIKECPTRNFAIGKDIYTFSFYLCQKKRVFREAGLLESEVPSSF